MVQQRTEEGKMKHLEDYLLTLEYCRRTLPRDTSRAHYERLRKIERIVRRTLADKNKIRSSEIDVLEQWFGNDALGG